MNHRFHRLQHRAERIVVILYFAMWGFDVVLAVSGWKGWGSTITSALFIVLLLSTFVMRALHANRLCEDCIAEWPLNPETEVKKRKRYIDAYHVIVTTGRRMIGMWLVFISAWIGTAFLLHSAGVKTDVNAIFMLPVALMMLTFYKHDFIRPWCPKCRWDDGGGEEWVPDPDPSMSKSG